MSEQQRKPELGQPDDAGGGEGNGRMTPDYLWDPSADPDAAVRPIEQALERVRAEAHEEMWEGMNRGRWWAVGMAACVAAAAGLIALGQWALFSGSGGGRGGVGAGGSGEQSWSVAAVAGMARVEERLVAPGAPADAVRAGEWVFTDAGSSAKFSAPGVGSFTLGPGGKARVVVARAGEHRMELGVGTMRAVITAPERVFFVETRGATAVDMGCIYDLRVDDAGDGELVVEYGRVDLEPGPGKSASGTVRVPMGARCRVFGASGPGTPVYADAPAELVSAVDRLDEAKRTSERAGASASVSEAEVRAILDAARPRDALTLWHLTRALDGEPGERVRERLHELAACPGVPVGEVPPRDADWEAWWSVVRSKG